MKIALFGPHGQLGFELQRSLAILGELCLCPRQTVDLADGDAIERWLDQTRPDLVVNAAAYTAVDKAESEQELAFAINAQAPAVMAAWAARHQAALVHYSTDYVYAGTGHEAWQESDAVAPPNVYGASKLAGEDAIRQSGARALIFRTSWVFGVHGGNFLKTMLRLFQAKTEMSVVADQVGVPTSARLLADVTLAVLMRGLPAAGVKLYHLAPRGETSWFDYASWIHAWLQNERPQWAAQHLSLQKLLAIPSSAYPTPAVRPLNSRLNVEKIEVDFNLQLPEWQQGVAHVLEQLLPE